MILQPRQGRYRYRGSSLQTPQRIHLHDSCMVEFDYHKLVSIRKFYRYLILLNLC
jgi:hypothetical protein